MSEKFLAGNSRCLICSGHHPINSPCFLSTNWVPLEKTPMNPPFCKDCKYAIPETPHGPIDAMSTCDAHEPYLDLVTGQYRKPGRDYCGSERLPSRDCGPEGKLFRRKE